MKIFCQLRGNRGRLCLLALLVLLLQHLPAMACTTCFGTPGSAQTQGMNAAILTLLGVTSVVLSVAATIGGVIFWRLRHLS